jgi:hypothetical protein
MTSGFCRLPATRLLLAGWMLSTLECTLSQAANPPVLTSSPRLFGKPLTVPRISPNPSGLSWNQTDRSLALHRPDRVVWQFHFDPQPGKPGFHPLTAPDGTLLTAWRPSDHPWHRALWWSWKYINGVNYWEENPQTGQAAGLTEILHTEASPQTDGSARIAMTLVYHPPGSPAVLNEQRLLNVSAPDASGGYRIDWQATFIALTNEVKLDRTPFVSQPGGAGYGGYAGLSVRFSPELRAWVFADSSGANDEKLLIGKTARWVSFHGKTPANQNASLAILDHPRNPRHPTPWYGKQDMPFLSPAMAFHEPLILTKNNNLPFRYRILIKSGEFNPATLEKEWTAFSRFEK